MRWAKRTVGWLIAGLAVAASVQGLWHVAADIGKMPPLGAAAIVAGLDGVTILIGWRLVEDPRRPWSWAALVTLAAVSAGAQILAAPGEAHWWRLLHGGPPLAALYAFHLAAAGDHRRAATVDELAAGLAGLDRDGLAALAGRLDPDAVKALTPRRTTPRKTPTDGDRPATPEPRSVAAPQPVRLDEHRRRKPPTTDTHRVQTVVAEYADRDKPPTRAEVMAAADVGSTVAGRLLPEIRAAHAATRKARSEVAQ